MITFDNYDKQRKVFMPTDYEVEVKQLIDEIAFLMAKFCHWQMTMYSFYSYISIAQTSGTLFVGGVNPATPTPPTPPK